MPPQLIDHPRAMYDFVRAAQRTGKRVGVVPTMGALHAGHLSLAEASKKSCDVTVVTIFVNPTQFGPNEDFAKYPRTLDSDLAALEPLGVDAVFVPQNDVMYPPGYSTFVDPPKVSELWEGRFRPGHFRGVATVVLKLFNACPADVAFFGAKDYQQTLVVRHMVQDLNLPIDIQVLPTLREPDGLAMSSRNRYLSASERATALTLSQSLQLAADLVAAGERRAAAVLARMHELFVQAGITQVDYIALADPETLQPVEQLDRPVVALIAARVGTTRLIDNRLIASLS
jgi:pantoate--beta-alanine ligase